MMKQNFTLTGIAENARCAESGKHGCVRKHTENAALKNTPLFFESERGFGGKRKPSFLVKRKFSLSPKLSPFTLIELLVVIAQYCRNHVKVLYDRIGMQAAGGGALAGNTVDAMNTMNMSAPQKPAMRQKNNKYCTSLRPSGRTSRLPQASSSHLHIFTQSAFTLIELLVSAACKTGVLYNRCGMLSLWGGALKTDKNGQKRISVRRRNRLWGYTIMLAKQALHAQTVRFIFAAGKCFIRRSRASFNQRSR